MVATVQDVVVVFGPHPLETAAFEDVYEVFTTGTARQLQSCSGRAPVVLQSSYG